MTRPARLVLDAGALTHNLAVVRRLAPRARVYAVVKADGYGHGLRWASRVLAGAGVDGFAVACIEEAQALRDTGVATAILLLEGCVDGAELKAARALKLDLGVHVERQVRDLERHLPHPGRIWLKLDTGMRRLGFEPDAVPELWPRLRAVAGAELGLMTHLARADEPGCDFTARQLARLRDVAPERDGAGADGAILGAANSAGVLDWPDAHLDWVRPGLMLYGAAPGDGRTGAACGLRPVAAFVSRLIAVKWVEAGEPVGYGGEHVTTRLTRLGVVAAGYGDGYPRQVPTGTPVVIGGQRLPILGRISMDMLTVDLTDCPRVGDGDEVTLWGPELPIEEIAAAANTIAYELMCRVTPRVRRELRPAG